ncbi:MAG: outer membrane lipoprotein chaperone LolA [Desulfonatronovibrionaceae bacterium]
MSKNIMILLGIVLLFSAGAAQASDLAEKIQTRYEGIESFQAGFTQILTNSATGEQEERSGQVSFQKPLLVRWEARSPQEEILVINDDVVWNYFPADQEVYRYQTDEVLTSRTMIRFISGQAELTREFEVENQGREHGLDKIKLVPVEPDANLVLAYIWADEEGLMQRVLLVDFFGNGNELRLENIDLDPEFEEGFFEFTPPEDAQIIEEDNES